MHRALAFGIRSVATVILVILFFFVIRQSQWNTDEGDDDDDDVNDEDCVDAIIGANIVLLLAIYPLDAAANLARDQVHFNSK